MYQRRIERLDVQTPGSCEERGWREWIAARQRARRRISAASGASMRQGE